MQSIRSVKFAFRRPSGIIAGLTAAWAIFGFILAIDSELNLPPGTFYKMIGISIWCKFFLCSYTLASSYI